MKIAIVDDEEIFRERIKENVLAYPWKDKIEIDMFSCGEDFCKTDGYELVFIDVEMGEMNGIQAAEIYKKRNEEAVIIVVSGYTEYCSWGYRVNALRFIDKFKMAEEIEEAIRAFEHLQERNELLSFEVCNLGKIKIRLRDIWYVESNLRKNILNTRAGRFEIMKSMQEMEEELKGKGFFRCHRSYLVNLDKIEEFNDVRLIMIDGTKINVSRRKKNELVSSYIERKIRYARM